MGLDVSIWAVMPVMCPHCGELVKFDVDSSDDTYYGSGGSVWHDFLPTIGGDIPYESPTDGEERYGKDYMLSKDELCKLISFVEANEPYNYHAILGLCYKVYSKYDNGYRLIINADW